MSEKFLDAFHQASNFTLTENNAVARATTNSALLDFFAQGGATRKEVWKQKLPVSLIRHSAKIDYWQPN